MRKVLGAIKIVRLVLLKPIDTIEIEGASIIERESELNVTISVDLDVISITDFMAKLSKTCAFSDISIKEMPMETIITYIYQSKENAAV